MQAIVLVFKGSGFGGVLRYLLATNLNNSWPYGTFIVNVLGSLFMGILFAYCIKNQQPVLKQL